MSPSLRLVFPFFAVLLAILCQGAAQTAEARRTADKQDAGPRYAFVCLASDGAPAAGTLEAKLAQYLKVDPAEVGKMETITGNEKTPKVGDAVSSVKVGPREVIVARAGFPIPKADIDYACMNSVFWPDAAQVLAKHKSHLIVTVLGQFASPIEEGLFLTRAIAACIDTYDALGIYWGHATVVHSPEFFRKYAVSATVEDPPVLLWVGFLRSSGDKEGTTTVLTRGLDVLGRMEIEVVDSPKKPSEIFERVADLAAHVLKKGNVVQDGQTVGADENDRVRARHVNSVLEREGKVLRIEW